MACIIDQPGPARHYRASRRASRRRPRRTITLARRSAVPVTLDLKLGSRPGEHLEAAAYYIASEALANAAKHAQASVVELWVDGRDGGLTLWVRDDGIGGADPRRGSGITGLKNRVAALGGTISVLSPPGHGTTLHVQLPAGRRE